FVCESCDIPEPMQVGRSHLTPKNELDASPVGCACTAVLTVTSAITALSTPIERTRGRLHLTHTPVSAATTTINPLAPVEINGEPAYAVHELLNFQRRNGTIQYLIDWEGYGPEEQSWVPEADILDVFLLVDFHTTHPDRPGPGGHGRPRVPCSQVSGAAHQVEGTVTNPKNHTQPRIAMPTRTHPRSDSPLLAHT
ncbi:hypothetical protein P4O66_019740, partial [Electrophorus voltai]